MKIQGSQNGKMMLSFINVGKACPSGDFLTCKIGLFTLLKK